MPLSPNGVYYIHFPITQHQYSTHSILSQQAFDTLPTAKAKLLKKSFYSKQS